MPIPKGFRWGVDSFMRITDIAHTDGKKTLFEFVVEKTKEIPAFWGRYIGRKDSTLQQKEIEFLRRASPSTRLLLIYNAFGINFVEDKDRKRRNPIDEFNRGTDTARAAASAADAFGAPGGVWIFVNVEPPPLGKVSSEWIRGLWDGMGVADAGLADQLLVSTSVRTGSILAPGHLC